MSRLPSLRGCSDPQLKEILKSLNLSERGENRFIIADLPGEHLFVKTERVDFIRRKVKQYSDSLHFEVSKDC